MNIDMAIFHQTFFEEATDLIADFERELLVIEEALDKDADLDDPEILNTIFRCAPSLKGGAATFGQHDSLQLRMVRASATYTGAVDVTASASGRWNIARLPLPTA